MYVYLAGQPVRELSGDAAANLLRKGWVQIADPPSHDATTQHAPTWDGDAWTIADKTQEEIAAATRRRWLPGQFWMRFTEAERIAIANSENQNVRVFIISALASPEIVSDAATTLAGLDLLVSAGILSAERQEAILNDA